MPEAGLFVGSFRHHGLFHQYAGQTQEYPGSKAAWRHLAGLVEPFGSAPLDPEQAPHPPRDENEGLELLPGEGGRIRHYQFIVVIFYPADEPAPPGREGEEDGPSVIGILALDDVSIGFEPLDEPSGREEGNLQDPRGFAHVDPALPPEKLEEAELLIAQSETGIERPLEMIDGAHGRIEDGVRISAIGQLGQVVPPWNMDDYANNADGLSSSRDEYPFTVTQSMHPLKGFP